MSRRSCNIDELNSSEWTFFTQWALEWLTEQSNTDSDFYATSQRSLNDGPLIDCMYRASVDDTTNADIVRWMLVHRRCTDDPVDAMVRSVRTTNDHPFPILQADACDLDSLAPPRQSTHNADRMVHYRITKMLIRLALTVRNLGQKRTTEPDYELFRRLGV
jgi:hypothetical protein